MGGGLKDGERTREPFGGGGRAGMMKIISQEVGKRGRRTGKGRLVRAFQRMRSQESRKNQKRTPLVLLCRGARKSGEKALVSGSPLLLVFVTSQSAQAVLTGQVKLKGNWRGLRPPPLLSSPTAKELVPNTGVETLPKVQGPGETTAWKC